MSNIENVAAVFSGEDAGPKPMEGPYGPIAPGARVTYAWATLLTQVGIYILSVVPAVIATVIVLIPIAVSMDVVISSDGTLPPELELPALVTAVVVQFPAWALLMFFWVRGFERRSLASAGLRGPLVLRSYGIGLGIGVAVAVVLALLSPLAAPETAVAVDDFDAARVLRADWLLMMGAVVVFFLIQGAAEEIACRGWMLSAVAARRGVIAGVLLNSAVFASLHVHVFRQDVIEVTMIFACILIVVTLAGWLGRRGLIGGLVVSALLLAVTPWSLTPQDLAFGLIAMAAIGGVGLFLSLWAVSQRSIVGSCGIHGAFNATIMIASMVAIAGSTPDALPQDVLLRTLREATGQEAEVSFGGVLLQLAVFGGLSAVIWRWLARRRPEFR